MSRLFILSLLTIAFMVQGCAFPEFGGEDSWMEEQPEALPLTISNAHLSGEIGSFRSLDHEARPTVWSDNKYTDIQLNVNTPDRSAMGLLQFKGDIDELLADEGTHFFSGIDFDPGNGAMQAFFIGCEGADEGVWDYDADADEIEISVVKDETNEASRSLTIRAVLTDDWGGSTVAFSSFNVMLRPEMDSNSDGIRH